MLESVLKGFVPFVAVQHVAMIVLPKERLERVR
jgi:hypothetical protein